MREVFICQRRAHCRSDTLRPGWLRFHETMRSAWPCRSAGMSLPSTCPRDQPEKWPWTLPRCRCLSCPVLMPAGCFPQLLPCHFCQWPSHRHAASAGHRPLGLGCSLQSTLRLWPRVHFVAAVVVPGSVLSSERNVQTLRLAVTGRESVHVRVVARAEQSAFSLVVDGTATSELSLTIPPGGEQKLQLLFCPKESSYFEDKLIVYVGDKTHVYAEVSLCGWGVFPYLSLSDAIVRLPVVPVGVATSAVVFLRAIGYSEPPQVRVELPALSDAAPVDVAFPDGSVVAGDAIPMTISLHASSPVSFDAPITLIDPFGARLVCALCVLIAAWSSRSRQLLATPF
jgi:hypothetical protein